MFVYVSRLFFPPCCAGVDVTANQDEISDHETFQLEFDPSTDRWYIRTMQDRYFTLQAGGGIQANETKRCVKYLEQEKCGKLTYMLFMRKHKRVFHETCLYAKISLSKKKKKNYAKLGVAKCKTHFPPCFRPPRSSNALFSLCWRDDGSVSFRANNGKLLGTKRSGHLFANCDDGDEDKARFYFYLVNRPVLVLKCEQGFVGRKASSASAQARLECNRANYETIQVERADSGTVLFKGEIHRMRGFFSSHYSPPPKKPH